MPDRICPVCADTTSITVCLLCYRRLHDGQNLVQYRRPDPNNDIVRVHQVHASCAQELRGEAEQ